jgi:hypothetical protein
MKDDLKALLTVCWALAVAAPGMAIAQATVKPAPREAEPVGRLFFTPAQRASLDVARSRRARTTLSQSEEAAPVAQTITYSGAVRRSDGKSTMWVNNRAISDNEATGGPIVGQVRPDGSITLSLPQSGRSVDLKPGQSVELLSGTIEEGYSRKPVASEPKPAAKPAADAKAEKPAAADRAREERDREEREQERLQDAISQALREAAAARVGSATTAPTPARQPVP